MTNFDKIKQMSKGEYAIHLIETLIDTYDADLLNMEKIGEMSAEEYVKWFVRYIDISDVCKYCPQYDNCEHYCADKNDSEIIYEWIYEWLNREAEE